MHFLLAIALAFGQTTATQNPFLKTTTEANGVFSLQTGAHRLTANGKPNVWLVGAAHIGSKSYYAGLQKLLDAQGEVLFEGVTQKPKPTPPATSKPQPPDAGPPAPPAKPIYEVLSDALGLDFQLVDINYNHPNWLDSDLSMDELLKLNKTASGGKPNQFDMIAKLLDPNSPVAKQFAVAIKMMTPGALEGLKLFFVQKVATLDPSSVLGDASTAEVVLKARNKSVEEFFAKAVAAPSPPASVAIFYGALHQQDLEAALEKRYGYKVAETRWFTAATADTKKVDVQGHMIYNLLDSQLSPSKAGPKK
ncbi:MAG: hypothetical protein ACYC96_00320 [Fimbriimonadaceae bacterium]